MPTWLRLNPLKKTTLTAPYCIWIHTTAFGFILQQVSWWNRHVAWYFSNPGALSQSELTRGGGTGSCWRSWMHHDDSFKGLWFGACFGESINLMLWWFAMLSSIPDMKWFEHARRIWTSWMSSMLHAFKNFRPNHQWTIDFSSSGSIKLTTGCEKGASEAFSQEQCPKLESGLRYPNSDQILYMLDSQWIHLGRCGCSQSLESHGSFV